ncbi:unnamed protein product [Microthlaspi erraticum]|uniref:RNase H type-1 domain-containing protein n=1 Tax=Microthlaspi erraticum TaxID=1685480 RepID=A0A6D2I9Y1_9BRAS|nr:unnamed protein product [Microthlaspi erraticum]
MKAMFDRVWHVVAPERTRVFLWLVVHQAIMTNMERQRRHLSDTGVCQVCRGGEESILHVLRDCPAMDGIWRRIVPARRRQSFFEAPLLSWVYENLGKDDEMGGYSWATVFAMSLWWGWKWRCWNVFGKQGTCRDRVQFLKDRAREASTAHEKVRIQGRRGERVERQIAWVPPESGWWKMNTDGASRGNPGLATAGGVLRGANGEWICGFALNIGICSAPLAELWGVYYGLLMAWERRVQRLVLEVDSEIVVGFLNAGINDSHPLSFIVRLCYGFLSRDWLVRVTDVYREANRVAVELANHAFSLPLGFFSYSSPPAEISVVLTDDALGSSRARFVRR